MNSDVLAERKQTHPMPRRDGEGLAITLNTLELAASLYDPFGGSIVTASGLSEGKRRVAHNILHFKAVVALFQES